MKLKPFQKQDLARAALKDGLIKSWDTGLGKTWALYLWSLLKVGFEQVTTPGGETFLQPKAPVLILAPGDLHAQITAEGRDHFRTPVRTLDSQNAFMTLCQIAASAKSRVTAEGRPVIPPGFYITSYTQLTTNGVLPLPDVDDQDPLLLLKQLCLPIGAHIAPAEEAPARHRAGESDSPFGPHASGYNSVCHFYAHRTTIWRDDYERLALDADSDFATLEKHYAARQANINDYDDDSLREQELERLNESFAILKHLVPLAAGAPFARLNGIAQSFIIREFLRAKINGEYSRMIGDHRDYPIGDPPEGYDPERPETDTRPKRRVKCLYSPSLADLSYDAFEAVVIDEGVKMKGEDTYVGKGVRSMEPPFRLVLTATPIKNRVPDIFRLAWWATGGKSEAHARFPYRDDPEERNKFAATFMVTENNLTKAAIARANGQKGGGSRFKKFTAEVCNVHLLWKLLGNIVLRRRKQDAGVDIVPKLRRVVRCEMGTLQKQVYQYHLQAAYVDKNGRPAVGAQLQSLRMASADPASELLPDKGLAQVRCSCWPDSNDDGTTVHPLKDCPRCHGSGLVPLPHRSGAAFVPKMATTLALIQEVLARKEQVVVFSAFNDPLDSLSRWLTQAGVRHVTLDGRVSQKNRGAKAAAFKQGRVVKDGQSPIPVMLAGVESMAEGHSWHLANNAILISYSWAYDKFVQAINRVHRMNSPHPVNIYVVLCQGTVDRKLEALIQEKGDASELVLDGQLLGERTEEVNLAELLQIAQREFNSQDATIDEALLQAQWPNLRAQLATSQRDWDADLAILQTPATLTVPAKAVTIPTGRRAPLTVVPVRTLSAPATEETWRDRVKRRAAALAVASSHDLWASL